MISMSPPRPLSAGGGGICLLMQTPEPPAPPLPALFVPPAWEAPPDVLPAPPLSLSPPLPLLMPPELTCLWTVKEESEMEQAVTRMATLPKENRPRITRYLYHGGKAGPCLRDGTARAVPFRG